MNEQIKKLEAEVDALQTLTMRAYGRFIFLRPMLRDPAVHHRINKERKVVGFEGLRNWLYWALILELSKICSDNNDRSPSIIRITEKLKDVQLRKQLEDKYVKNNRELGEGEWGEAQLRTDFDRKYSDYLNYAEGMLSSQSVGGYKTIRDKLISHNELRWSGSGYDFYDVKDAKVKYGDERVLLETLRVLVDHLLHIVQNVDFSWDSFFRIEEKYARNFWDLEQSRAGDAVSEF
jgi:hypothetical protein